MQGSCCGGLAGAGGCSILGCYSPSAEAQAAAAGSVLRCVQGASGAAAVKSCLPAPLLVNGYITGGPLPQPLTNARLFQEV